MGKKLSTGAVSGLSVGRFVIWLSVLAAALPHAVAIDDVTSPNPELTGQLTKALSITPAQASGGAGALLSLAKSRLSPGDFSKVAASVPGIEGLMKSAPPPSKPSPLGAASGQAGALPGSLGGLVSLAAPFKKLGLPPEMAAKFVPVLTKYVESKGGASVASLLSGALK